MFGQHFDWSDARVEQLSTLWRGGHTAARIAVEMGHGLTRNAIIGKITRLGLPTRAQMAGAPPPLNASQKEPAPAPSRPAVATLVPAPRVGIAITDLAIDSCRWPVDVADGPMRYCGATKPRTARAYCAVHAPLAYTPSGVRAGIHRERGAAPAPAASPLRKAG